MNDSARCEHPGGSSDWCVLCGIQDLQVKAHVDDDDDVMTQPSHHFSHNAGGNAATSTFSHRSQSSTWVPKPRRAKLSVSRAEAYATWAKARGPRLDIKITRKQLEHIRRGLHLKRVGKPLKQLMPEAPLAPTIILCASCAGGPFCSCPGGPSCPSVLPDGFIAKGGFITEP